MAAHAADLGFDDAMLRRRLHFLRERARARDMLAARRRKDAERRFMGLSSRNLPDGTARKLNVGQGIRVAFTCGHI